MSELRALGVAENEERIYRHVLRTPGLDQQLLASELGMSSEAVAEATEGLRRLGLATTTGESDRIYPTPPTMALHLLQLRTRQSLLNREEELNVAQLEAQRLIEEYEAERQRDSNVEIIETIHGRELISQHCEMLLRATKTEVLVLDRPPYATTGVENPAELEMLGRGVACRAIYDPTALELPGQSVAMKRNMDAGEQARILDNVPLKLVIFDGRVALVPLNLSQPTIAGSLVVHASALLDALVMLFETMWKSAVPVASGPIADAPELTEWDQRLLTLMSAGLSDQRISRQLGVSARTLARRINHITDLLEVNSRFEAGVVAARRGWV